MHKHVHVLKEDYHVISVKYTNKFLSPKDIYAMQCNVCTFCTQREKTYALLFNL